MKKMIIALCLTFTAAALADISEAQVRKETVQNGKIGLATRLILPDEPLITPPPVLIIVHGSGKDATWPVYEPLVERLIQSGFGVAFFDKRGTGESSGRFLNISVKKSTEVFGQLSSDVVAVAEWVAKQPGIDKHRIGLFGLSQGGWIAPLAANKTELISYSVILFGPVASLGQERRSDLDSERRLLEYFLRSLREGARGRDHGSRTGLPVLRRRCGRRRGC